MVIEVHIKPVNNRSLNVATSKEQLKEEFKRHDANRDGKLSKEEIRQTFKDLGSKCGLYRAWEALHQADADKNGYITITDKELDYLVDYASKQGYMGPN